MKKILNIIQTYSLAITPSVTILLGIILSFTPYKVDHISLLMPYISYVTIYFWTIYYPERVPYFIIMLLGLLKDALESNILGLSALYFLLFQALVKSQKKYINNNLFIVVWTGFVFCLAMILLLPLLLSQFIDTIPHYSLSIIFIHWLITVFTYVPIHSLLSKLHE